MKLYAWGANSHGQLGLGYSSEECRVPTLATNLPADLASNLGKVKSIVGGGGHTLILTQDGAVYSCGWNTKGQLGYPTEKAEQKDFRRIEKLADLKISRVACGWDHSLALTCDGRVFSWGSNAFSQLGIPKSKVPSHTVDPMAVDIPAPVISIAAGLRHSAAADEAGHVHVWGTGRHGQLGLTFDGQPLTETDKPQTIAWDEEAVKVCCGQYHTAVQCRNGHVYTFGQNKFGQLILPVQKSSSHTPCLVTEMSWIGKGKLMEVFAGWTHGVAHTESGHVFTWGRGDYGQLGRTVNQSRSNSETDPKPSQVKLPSNVVSVAVGSEHCMALLDTGAVAIWGWNEHGTCGTKDLNNILAPMILPVSLKEAAVCVGCGAGTSFMLVDETLPRPKQDRSLLSKVANVVLGAASGGSVTGVPLINDNGGKYSAVPGTTDSAQTAWDQCDGEAVRRDSDGETLLKSGKKKSKAFRLGAANTKDGSFEFDLIPE